MLFAYPLLWWQNYSSLLRQVRPAQHLPYGAAVYYLCIRRCARACTERGGGCQYCSWLDALAARMLVRMLEMARAAKVLVRSS